MKNVDIKEIPKQEKKSIKMFLVEIFRTEKKF